jgi:hypothetical protein
MGDVAVMRDEHIPNYSANSSSRENEDQMEQPTCKSCMFYKENTQEIKDFWMEMSGKSLGGSCNYDRAHVYGTQSGDICSKHPDYLIWLKLYQSRKMSKSEE